MEILAQVINTDGKVELIKFNDGTFGVTATIAGKYKSCYGLTEKTACKRFSKYTKKLAEIYYNATIRR